MKTIRFEIAKKMKKETIKGGILLSSAKGMADAWSFVVLADDCNSIKESASAFKALANKNLSFRSRAKGVEIASSNPSDLFEFAKQISFSSEDALDVIELMNNLSTFSNKKIDIDSISLSKDSFHMVAFTDLEEGETPSAFYDQLMTGLNPLGMGVIKEKSAK